MNNFVRGQDPKEALGIGYKEVFKSMEGCIMVTERDLYPNINNRFYDIETITVSNIRVQSKFIFNAFVIIVCFKDQFRIMKNRISADYQIYPIEELPEMIFRLKILYDKWMKERNQL